MLDTHRQYLMPVTTGNTNPVTLISSRLFILGQIRYLSFFPQFNSIPEVRIPANKSLKKINLKAIEHASLRTLKVQIFDTKFCGLTTLSN